jgi:hypothetical protein
MPADLRSAAPDLAATALRTVRIEYPYDLRAVYRAPGDVPLRPHDRHPAFYGCYDWHSAVLMHWVLVRLLRLFPAEVPAGEIRALLDEHLTPAAIETETAYFVATPGFERPYGWGWALTLHEELASWPDAAPWAAAVRPLADYLLDAFARWLPAARYPVRYGVHPNSAFGLVRALPAARRRAATGDDLPLRAIEDAAFRWFRGDRDVPIGWEPSGSDFLSPSLTEAVLMAEVLSPEEFEPWLSAFLPRLDEGPLFEPAVVGDDRDGQTAHLHGLNLSRAWAMRRLAATLPAHDARRPVLLDSAEQHAEPELSQVSGSDYMVEHWLAAYALLYLDEAY